MGAITTEDEGDACASYNNYNIYTGFRGKDCGLDHWAHHRKIYNSWYIISEEVVEDNLPGQVRYSCAWVAVQGAAGAEDDIRSGKEFP